MRSVTFTASVDDGDDDDDGGFRPLCGFGSNPFAFNNVDAVVVAGTQIKVVF